MRVLTVARDLRRRHARERHQLFVAEGVRAVDELLRSPLTIRGALVRADTTDPRVESLVSALRGRNVPIHEASEAEFTSAADTDSPQGVLAIAEVPTRKLSSLPVSSRFRMVVLDAVQDPGNVGTIVRTAAALEANATVALPGTVDLWNAKVVRSSMGAHFHHPALACTWEELIAFLGINGIALWGADASGERMDDSLSASPVPDRLAIAVGNEGAGLTRQARTRVDKLIAIEIASGVESLNVAVATGIMLYELRR